MPCRLSGVGRLNSLLLCCEGGMNHPPVVEDRECRESGVPFGRGLVFLVNEKQA